MLEMWEFVLILFGVEIIVVMVVSAVVWKRCQWKRKQQLNNSTSRENLDHMADTIIIENMLLPAARLEYGRPPVSHQSSRNKERQRKRAHSMPETEYDTTMFNSKPRTDTQNVHRVNPSYDPDVLNYHPKSVGSVPSTTDSYNQSRFPIPEVHLSPFPDSEYSSILRKDLVSPVNSDDPTNYSLTPINPPNVTRAPVQKRGSDARSLNSILLMSRPSMVENSPFDPYSRNITQIDEGPSQGRGHVSFETLWESGR